VYISSGVGCGSPVTSNAVTLTVNNLPSISVQPSSDAECAGASSSFSSKQHPVQLYHTSGR